MIGQVALPLNNEFDYYNLGTDVNIYIVDTVRHGPIAVFIGFVMTKAPGRRAWHQQMAAVWAVLSSSRALQHSLDSNCLKVGMMKATDRKELQQQIAIEWVIISGSWFEHCMSMDIFLPGPC